MTEYISVSYARCDCIGVPRTGIETSAWLLPRKLHICFSLRSHSTVVDWAIRRIFDNKSTAAKALIFENASYMNTAKCRKLQLKGHVQISPITASNLMNKRVHFDEP